MLWSADQHLDAAIEPIAALAPALMVRGSNEMSGWCYELRDELADNLAVQSTATLHALICRGDLPETRRLIERVGIMTGGDLSAVLFAMGYVAYLEGDFAAAIEALERFDAHRRSTGSPVEQFDAAVAPRHDARCRRVSTSATEPPCWSTQPQRCDGRPASPSPTTPTGWPRSPQTRFTASRPMTGQSRLRSMPGTARWKRTHGATASRSRPGSCRLPNSLVS